MARLHGEQPGHWLIIYSQHVYVALGIL